MSHSHSHAGPSGRVLIEIAPDRVDVEAVGLAMAAHADVAEVHGPHVWEIRSGFLALSVHVLAERDADCHALRRKLEPLPESRFEIDRTTLQVDHIQAGRLLQIGSEMREQH